MKIPRWAQVLIGVGIVMVFLGIGAIIAVTAYFSEHVIVAESTAGEVDDEFQKVRDRFKGQPALVELRDGVARQTRDVAAATAVRSNLQTLHVLAWDAHEERLVSVNVPWWVVRLKSGPIRFSTYAAGLSDTGVSLRPEDIEKQGPGIILEGTGPRGERVLLWAD